MSEFHIIELTVSDQETLLSTLREMHYQPTVHEEAQQLYGYRGDLREQRAHIIIPRKQVGGASNDVGFERKADGSFIMHLSEYDQRVNTFDIKKMNQLYAKNRLNKAIKLKGRYSMVSQKTEKDGRIHIRLRVR